MKIKKILILGSTGSIGKSTLNVIKKYKSEIKIVCLSSNKNYKKLYKQSKLFNVKNLIITDYKYFLKSKEYFKNKKINIFPNVSEYLKKNKKKIDLVIVGISGLEGLMPTIEIIPFTKNLASANKESIICGWKFIQSKAKKYKTNFIPIDSEHFSVWSLINNDKDLISKIYLTASGGPLLNSPSKNLKNINIKKVINHPNWSMGKKISTDSASMMNKVFEVIEASKIFNLKKQTIKIIVHPKSIVHAIVVFKNGLIKVLIHETSMEIPIFNIIFKNTKEYFYRKTDINFKSLNGINFIKPDTKKFPYINILNKYIFKNTYFETILVTINDELVRLFLNKKISFLKMQKLLLKFINYYSFTKYYNEFPKNTNDIYIMADKVKAYLKKNEKIFK
ncbi:1-deoxy-D-xylulose-5-phosphate reductoisomerase [Candidatus Pelagibacter sp. RS40]|uniref:1-deoxy-D-xylulose-5-phosphate reductoisomerase n=1 Tax=Candidatus Pelagibacter sp. RS40 TaxID=1977865 RepID=UPI001E2CCB83|nr:1-deoxy-D-xylulose-5-phosphate reductoisomerase [Candidatus Pelagibacter sp. RS40]